MSNTSTNYIKQSTDDLVNSISQLLSKHLGQREVVRINNLQKLGFNSDQIAEILDYNSRGSVNILLKKWGTDVK